MKKIVIKKLLAKIIKNYNIESEKHMKNKKERGKSNEKERKKIRIEKEKTNETVQRSHF